MRVAKPFPDERKLGTAQGRGAWEWIAYDIGDPTFTLLVSALNVEAFNTAYPSAKLVEGIKALRRDNFVEISYGLARTRQTLGRELKAEGKSPRGARGVTCSERHILMV